MPNDGFFVAQSNGAGDGTDKFVGKKIGEGVRAGVIAGEGGSEKQDHVAFFDSINDNRYTIRQPKEGT